MLKNLMFVTFLSLAVSCLCNLNRFFPKLISAKSKIIQHNNNNVEDNLSNMLNHSFEIALENCKEQFKWDRWNCPPNDFLIKRSSRILSKETAYVQAISFASVMYTFLINYTNANKSKHLCFDQIDYAEEVAHLQVFHQKRILDEANYVQLHNLLAGRIAITKSLKKHCKYSKPACYMSKCFLRKMKFSEIANYLRKMYDKTALLKFNNYNNNLKKAGLIYLEESPNYCKKNAIPNWKGMHGRQCSQNKENSSTIQERKSCKHLCRKCGLRIREQKDLKNVRCNCRFNGSSVVTCDVCINYVKLLFCE